MLESLAEEFYWRNDKYKHQVLICISQAIKIHKEQSNSQKHNNPEKQDNHENICSKMCFVSEKDYTTQSIKPVSKIIRTKIKIFR